MAIGKLWSVTLDCADAQQLAQFWAQALDGKVSYESDNFVGVELPGGTWIGAYRIDGYQSPVWPSPTGYAPTGGETPIGTPPKQFHLDLSVPELDVAERALLKIGATKAGHQPEPDRWRVLLDPAGHPFCITVMSG